MGFGKNSFGSPKISRSRGGESGGHGSHDDLMVAPLLDLFVALIPFLILSVVLTKINIVDVGISKPVASAQKPKSNFNLKLTLDQKSAKIFLSKKHFKTIPLQGDNWMKDVHAALVEIKKKNPDEYQIRIEPSNDVALDHIMGLMDAARKLNDSDGEIIKTDKETGKKVRLKFLFPTVVLRGVYS